MYRVYRQQLGGIMLGNSVEFLGPFWADEDSEVVGSGRLTDKYEKKGRKIICYDVDFERPDGTMIMSVNHMSAFPE
jgi:hypothetical protein